MRTDIKAICMKVGLGKQTVYCSCFMNNFEAFLFYSN